MGKFFHDDVLDATLNEVADNGDKMFVCTAQPTTYTEASVTYVLATITLTVGDGNGDYTVADDGTSGRKLTVAAQSAASVTANGTATHVAIGDSGNSKVLAVTTTTSQSLTSGGTVDVPTFDLTVNDPA